MRVTHEMISKQVVFNLQNNISRFFKLQNQMSTNRRINKVSDDPIGTVRDLSYRERLTELTQFKANISIGSTWLASSDRSMSDMNNAIKDAQAIAVEMSNDTNDANAREAAANEVQSLFDQVLGAGNTQLQNSYLFGGYRTRTKPFETNVNGVVYRGDSGTMNYSIDSRSKVQVNTIGSNILTKPFQAIGANSDINMGITGATALASLHLDAGIDQAPGTFVIRDENQNINATIDLSAATDVQSAITAINTQLTAAGITNVTASIGLEGNNLRLVAVDDPTITATTPLVNLNGGLGVDALPGKFTIRNTAGTTSVAIDITGASTVGDVLTAIDTQLATAGVTNVTAAINGGGTGITITDSNGVPLDLLVEEFTQSDTTAANLGLLGNINPVLNGTNLNPRPSFTVSESAVGETTAVDLGLLGQFNYSKVGDGLRPQMTAGALVSQISNNTGLPQGEFRIFQGDSSAAINTADPSIVTIQDLLDRINTSGLAVTATINSAGTGIQIANNDPTRTLMINNDGVERVASKLGIAGAADVLGSMMLLTQALRDDDREIVQDLVGTMGESLTTVLNERAAAGAKVIHMETTLNRLEEYEVYYTKLLSDVEDADLTKLITDLAMQENAYNAALNSAAKILQPSLLDFIR
ncbi:MAG: flagellar hook-associated protein FlgL [Candidatus Zixiibacteriota bacterium]